MNNGRCQNCKANCRKLMKRIHELDFAINEVVLYLDMYPACAKALAYYHQLHEARQETVALYEEACGPLTPFGNNNRTRWQWTDSPMPWEPEAN